MNESEMVAALRKLAEAQSEDRQGYMTTREIDKSLKLKPATVRNRLVSLWDEGKLLSRKVRIQCMDGRWLDSTGYKLKELDDGGSHDASGVVSGQ